VFSDTVLDLSPSFVRFGLATALWFVLVVIVIDSARRQLAALGVVTYDDFQLRISVIDNFVTDQLQDTECSR
jgi:hypothetical protein